MRSRIWYSFTFTYTNKFLRWNFIGESTDLSLLQLLGLFFGFFGVTQVLQLLNPYFVSQQEALLHLLLLVCVVDK